MELAKSTDHQIEELAESAKRIDDVVQLISGIADQTNLLALNASIEAARAGEAGAGFAVVASEVKTLAEETNDATADIGSRVAAIQMQMSEAVEAIRSIVEVIGEIDAVGVEVAATVEQQRATTDEIAEGAATVAQNTSDVAEEIATVSDSTSITGAASEEMLATIDVLRSDSEQLAQATRDFLDRVRA
ncbi:MAG: methyl-accepting chemotaxis protein [Actinomycetota bacterium]